MINENQKWPQDKEAYDRNWIRCFGVECPQCVGSGIFAGEKCATCDGMGKVEKKKSPGKWKDCLSENPEFDTNPGW